MQPKYDAGSLESDFLTNLYYGKDNKLIEGMEIDREACQYANLEGCRFRQCSFTDIDFENSSWESAVLEECIFVNCMFTKVDFQSVSMIECEFDSCTFEGVDLDNSYFHESKFLDCSFDGCTGKDAYLVDIHVSGGEFKRCYLDKSFFSSVCFEDCDVRGCDFTQCDFLKSCFKRCDLTDSFFQDSVPEIEVTSVVHPYSFSTTQRNLSSATGPFLPVNSVVKDNSSHLYISNLGELRKYCEQGLCTV